MQWRWCTHTHILITVCWARVFLWDSWTLNSFSRIQSRSLVSGFFLWYNPKANRIKDWTSCPKINNLKSVFQKNKMHKTARCVTGCILKTYHCYLSGIIWSPGIQHTCTWMHIHPERVSHNKTGKGHSPVYHLGIDYLLWSEPLCVCACVRACMHVCVHISNLHSF